MSVSGHCARLETYLGLPKDDENTESIASRLGSIENHLGAMAKGTASLHERVAAIEQCPGKPVDGTPSICNSMQRGQDPIQSNPSPMDGLD